jgi:hypothetical protein
MEGMMMERPTVKKISLSAEQTKRFLSFFVAEAIELAKKRREAAKQSGQQTQLKVL